MARFCKVEICTHGSICGFFLVFCELVMSSYSQFCEVLSFDPDTEGAAELHGHLLAMLCLDRVDSHAGWQDELASLYECDLSGIEARGFVARHAKELAEAVAAGEMQWNMVLPGDDMPMVFRARALAAWCSGFLYGFSTAPMNIVHRQEVKEWMSELADIANVLSRMKDGYGASNADEDDLLTIQEHVRMLVQSAYFDLHSPGQESLQ